MIKKITPNDIINFVTRPVKESELIQMFDYLYATHQWNALEEGLSRIEELVNNNPERFNCPDGMLKWVDTIRQAGEKFIEAKEADQKIRKFREKLEYTLTPAGLVRYMIEADDEGCYYFFEAVKKFGLLRQFSDTVSAFFDNQKQSFALSGCNPDDIQKDYVRRMLSGLKGMADELICQKDRDRFLANALGIN